MSKGIRYDSLLVRVLAAELDERFRGRRIRALRFSAEERTITLAFREETVTWDLHPDRGWITVEARREPGTGLSLPPGARIGRISAPPDERVVEIELEAEQTNGGYIQRINVELIGTHRNAIAVDAAGITRAVLRPRPESQRPLAIGVAYPPVPSAPRAGALEPPSPESWARAFAGVDVADRRRVLLASFAWTSPLNAPYVLADDDIDAAYARYSSLLATTGEAWVLWPDREPQPYPVRLNDRSARRETDLLAAFATAAALRLGAAAHQTFVADTAAALQRVRERLDRMDVRIARLRDQLRGAPEEAAALRQRADLLLAQLHNVAKGATFATLDDFSGGTLVVELDPGLSPSANAARLYDAAKKRERAAARTPQLIASAEAERARLAALESRIAQGAATAEELARLARPEPKRPRTARPAARPYRSYRTSAGREVRVGRSGRANDELTFHHSDPDDIRLHAQSVPGAHVILRWGRRDAGPPARDLEEAAVLAAVHSRARTSAVVPVVWARRKHVRKPRKAPPGRVVVERARTLFVEPSEELEKRLRDEDDV